MQGEVQGEDEEDYMKKEGMIGSSNDGMHCEPTNRYPSYSSIKLSRIPKLTNSVAMVKT